MSDPTTPASDEPTAPPPYIPAPTTPPMPSRRRRTLLIVAAVVAGLIAFGLVRWGLTSAFDGPSKQETIDKSVALIKKQAELPKQVDSVTTWTDVEAEAGAIHYEYTVASTVDPASLTEKGIRDLLLPTLCSTAATKDILDHDIKMRYSYAITGSSKTIDTTFTKADC